MNATASKDALRAGIEQVSKEAAGLLDVMVIQLADLPDIISDVMAGGQEASMLLSAINSALAGIAAAPRRAPALCVSCPRPLKHGRFSFGLVLPRCDDPTRAIALAVCHRCATDRDDIQARAISGLRRIWPDLRPITVTHPAGGHA